MIEYLFYSLLLGAIIFGIVWAVSRNNELAWVVSLSAGAIVILFVFADPKAAKTLGDIANNLTLFILKAMWVAGWVVGAWGASVVTSKFEP